MNRATKLLSALALLLLSACILVEDFGTAWDKAKPDSCLTKIAQSLYYAEFQRDPSEKHMDDLARGITLDGQNFLLLKKDPEDKGGRLYKFDVAPGHPSTIFTRYRLVPTMRATFEKNYPNAPVSLKRDTVSIETLNAETEALLVTIAKNPKYWEAEDKVLYNTLHNPACRFDDGMETEFKPIKKKNNARKSNDQK